MESTESFSFTALTLGIALAPVYICSLVLALLYRLIIHVILLITRPNYFGMLNVLELFFDREKGGASSNINILFQLKLTDFTSVEEVRQEMNTTLERILKEKTKMRCTIKEFWGIRYWEVGSVDVDKQVGRFQPRTVTDVKDYMADIAAAPISNNILWEIILADNTVEDHYPCIFRIHHSLADGYALRLFFHDAKQISIGRHAGKLDVSKKNSIQFEGIYNALRKLYSEIRSAVIMFLCAPAICIEQYQRERDQNSLRPVMPALKKQLGWKRTDINKVKEIHEKTGRSCTTVLLTALSAALDELFKKRGETVPYATTIFPFRRTQASNELTNEFIPVGLKLPVDTGRREIDVTNTCLKLKNQPNYKINYFIPRYACLLFPRPLPDWAFRSTEHTVVFSNFPAPSDKFIFNGFECDHLLFFVPNFHVNNAVGITIASYNGICHIASILDRAVVRSESDAQDIVDCMAKYIDDTHSALSP